MSNKQTDTEIRTAEQDEFDKAFAERTAPAGEDAATKLTNDSKVDGDDAQTKSEDSQPQPTSVVKPPPTEDNKPVAKAADSDHPPVEDQTDWKAEATTLRTEVERLTREVEAERHRTSSWEGRITAANKRAEKAEKQVANLEQQLRAAAQAKTDVTSSSLPEEDEQALKEFLTEFPSLEKPLRVLIRKEAETLVDKRTPKPDSSSTSQAGTEDADNGSSSAKENEEEERAKYVVEHWRKIKAKHGPLFKQDSYELLDLTAFNKRIDVQPALIRKQFESYRRQGTAEEIIEMLDLYQGAVGAVKSKTKETIEHQTQDLEAVPHRPGEPPKEKVPPDKNDFDAAFEEGLKRRQKK